MTVRRRRRTSPVVANFAEERQTAVQALLNRPFVSRQRDPEMYELVRDHYRVLRDWFHEQTGWGLIVTRQFAKLEKTPGRFQPWMAIDGFRDGRDYGYFTFGLWFLEGLNEGQQFLLSEMVESIREHLVANGLFVDWGLYDYRMSMARALKKLRELDVLVAVEGDETHWARVGEADVLYQASALSRYVLQRLPEDIANFEQIVAPSEDLEELNEGLHIRTRGAMNGAATLAETPSQSDGPADSHSNDTSLSDRVLQQRPDSLTSIRRRHQVMRRILQESVIYDWQWTEDERRYVQTQRSSIIDRVDSFTGLQGRRFREGLLFVWPDVTAEMELFPTLGVLSDIVLVMASALRQRLEMNALQFDRDDNGCYRLTRSDVESLVMEVRSHFGEFWSKEYRELSTSRVAEDALEHICEWNLGARVDGGGLIAYPSLLRWAGEYQQEGSDME